MSQQAVFADIIPNSAVWAPPARAARVQHMIQLTLQKLQSPLYKLVFIYLCIQYCFIQHFFGQVVLYRNIFNKSAYAAHA
jgi:hypothetical protein